MLDDQLTCLTIYELRQLIEGELSAVDAKIAEKHLEDCDGCRRLSRFVSAKLKSPNHTCVESLQVVLRHK